MGRHLHFLLVLLICLTFMLPTAMAKKKRSQQAGPKTAITSIAIFPGNRFTRVVIHLDRKPNLQHHGTLLANEEEKLPHRLYLDLQNTDRAAGYQENQELPAGPIQAIRFGYPNNKKTMRLVFDLSRPQQIKVDTLSDNRITIDLFDNLQEVAPSVDEELIQQNGAVAEPPAQAKSSYLIVLDPGHGGDDTGAVGPTGLQEKNVSLELALALRTELLKDDNIEVLLTRQQDRELQLKERTNFANHHQADLFISIHSNASTDRSASGFSTYYLNNSDDRFSQRLAAVENSAAMETLEETEIILNYLKMNKTTISSQKLAQTLQEGALATISSPEMPIRDHGVLTALFYVLLGAKMPAALVECNFISNPVEETLLANEQYRQKVVQGLAQGIRTYLKTL